MGAALKSLNTVARIALERRFAPLAFTLLLMALHFDTMTLPPPEDQALGIWTEAAFLYDSNFDFAYLWRHGQVYKAFGERAYLVSVLPVCLALLRMATGSAMATIVAYKLLLLFCGGVIGAILYRFLRRWLDAGESFLVSITALTIPLIAGQLDVIGMELPVTVFIALGVLAAVDGRIPAASLWYMLAGIIKLIAIVPLIATLVYALLVLALGAVAGMPVRQWRSFGLGTVLCALVLVAQINLFRLSGQSDRTDRIRPTGPRLAVIHEVDAHAERSAP